MTMKSSLERIQTTVCCATCAAALLLAAGCATKGYERGNRAAQDVQTAANRIAALPLQIERTTASLDDLINKPQADLRPQFRQFNANLNEVESTARDIATARRAMGERSKEFFAAWDAQLAEINNEDIRARSQARKTEVTQRMDGIKRDYAVAEAAFRPFLSELQDVRKFLSLDLTPGGLAAIKPTVTKANANAAQLTATITQLTEEFRALGLAMSSVTPAAK
jgi:hypothetical protein